MPITSQGSSGTSRFGDVPVTDLRQAGLLVPGVIKPVLFTLEARLIIKLLGRLGPADAQELRHALAQLLG